MAAKHPHSLSGNGKSVRPNADNGSYAEHNAGANLAVLLDAVVSYHHAYVRSDDTVYFLQHDRLELSDAIPFDGNASQCSNHAASTEWGRLAYHASGVQASARISPNSRLSFPHDVPPSVERYSSPLTLLA